jgi:hypothetical protein
MIHLDHYNSKHCGFCMVFVGFVPGAQGFPMSSQFFPLVPAASLATLCTRALFSVWLQATLASKGRPWTWLTKTPTIVSIVSIVTIVTCGPSLPFDDNYTSNESWWTLVEWTQDAGIKTAASCQWLPGFNSSPAVLCGPAFCGALTGEPKVRPPLQQTPQLLMNRIATGDKPTRTCNILQLPQLLGGWTLQSFVYSNYIIRLYSSYTIIII